MSREAGQTNTTIRDLSLPLLQTTVIPRGHVLSVPDPEDRIGIVEAGGYI